MSESSLQLTKDAQLAQNGVGFNLKLTQGGAVLLAKALAGQQLEFKYVTLGSGVGSGNPEEATSFVNKVADLFITKCTRLDTSVIIEAVLEYNSVPQGFTWTELGVIAVDPDTQAEVLYMYDYVDIGEVIPPAGTATQIEKHLRISTYVSNAANVTAEINESLINIPRSDIGKPNGVAPLGPNTALEIEYGGTGAKTAQEALYNLGGMSRENLLDNAHFVGGGTDGNFPINPKGLKQYNTVGSCIPRWKLQNANSSLEIVDDGIILRNSATEFEGAIIPLLQKVARNANQETVTYAIIASEVSGDWFMAYGNTTNGNKKIDIGLTFITVPAERVTLNNPIFYLFKTSKNSNDYIKFQDLKLEKGDTQTLGWKDINGNIHLFDTPDYVRELVKCQRYLQVGKPAHFYAGAMYGQKEGVFIVPTPIEMRIRQPSVSVDTVPNVRVISYDGTSVQLTNDELSVLGSDCFGIKVKVTLSGDKVLPIGTAVTADAVFTFDAEL